LYYPRASFIISFTTATYIKKYENEERVAETCRARPQNGLELQEAEAARRRASREAEAGGHEAQRQAECNQGVSSIRASVWRSRMAALSTGTAAALPTKIGEGGHNGVETRQAKCGWRPSRLATSPSTIVIPAVPDEGSSPKLNREDQPHTLVSGHGNWRVHEARAAKGCGTLRVCLPVLPSGGSENKESHGPEINMPEKKVWRACQSKSSACIKIQVVDCTSLNFFYV